MAELSRFNLPSYLACITCATSITSSTISKLSIFKLQNWAFLLQWVVCWCNALLNFSFNYLLASPLLSQLFNYLPAILKCPFFNPHDWQLLALQKLFSCIHWVAWCTCSWCNPAYQILSLICSKSRKKGDSCQLFARWLEMISFQSSRVEPSPSYRPLCQPLSTLHLPLHQHLHHGFKLGLCWPLLPIHQTKARTDFNNLLFVPLPIWDNNGHLALRQCKTNYIVGVFNWSTLRKSNAQR